MPFYPSPSTFPGPFHLSNIPTSSLLSFLCRLSRGVTKAHIFHGVKTLTSDLREMSELSSSFLLAKKGIGSALVPLMPHAQGSATTQVDNLWIKLVDTMRLEVGLLMQEINDEHIKNQHMSEAAVTRFLEVLYQWDCCWIRCSHAFVGGGSAGPNVGCHCPEDLKPFEYGDGGAL